MFQLLGIRNIVPKIRDSNTELTTLDLYQTDLDEVMGKGLAILLERNTALESLSLCRNRLGEVGGTAIAGALERNTTLTRLNFI